MGFSSSSFFSSSSLVPAVDGEGAAPVDLEAQMLHIFIEAGQKLLTIGAQCPPIFKQGLLVSQSVNLLQSPLPSLLSVEAQMLHIFIGAAQKLLTMGSQFPPVFRHGVLASQSMNELQSTLPSLLSAASAMHDAEEVDPARLVFPAAHWKQAKLDR